MAVTVKLAAVKEQLTAPLGVYVHPVPVILDEPADTPVAVEPDTVAMAGLEEEKDPPVKPAGAERLEVWPTLTEFGDKETDPAGQMPGLAVTT